MSNPQNAPKAKWHQQVRETYTFTKKHVNHLGVKLLTLFVSVYGIMLGIGFSTGYPVLFAIAGFGVAFITTTFIFGKVAERAAYGSIRGQFGAAASVMNALPQRQGWFTTPGVGVDKAQNVVHRLVGRPGIVLVGEGPRPSSLLAEQRKLHARFVPGVEIHEIIVGDNDVTLIDLQKTIKKLPKSLRPSEVTEVRRKLQAIPQSALPIPKGPMPQGRKIPRR